jgi:hypothetical protein
MVRTMAAEKESEETGDLECTKNACAAATEWMRAAADHVYLYARRHELRRSIPRGAARGL